MIIKAELKHANEIDQLESIVFPGWPIKPAYTIAAISENDSWVAVEDNQIIGFILVADEGFWGHEILSSDKNCKNILRLAVKDGYRNKGIGKQLLNKVHEQYNNTTIRVDLKNEIAKSLYRKLGYKTIAFTLNNLAMERLMPA